MHAMVDNPGMRRIGTPDGTPNRRGVSSGVQPPGSLRVLIYSSTAGSLTAAIWMCINDLAAALAER